jgi:hypothetical protein
MSASAYPRLRAALPVGPVPRPPGPPRPDVPVDDPEALTRDLLERAAATVGPQARVTGFRRWWDGDAWVPLLTLRIAGRPAWLVESGGQLQVLPPRQRQARWVLRRGRPVPSGGPLAPPRTRQHGSIAVGAPTRRGVEVLRGALSPRQLRERAEARRRALVRSGVEEAPGQLGLFEEADEDAVVLSSDVAGTQIASAGRRRQGAAPPPVRVVRVVYDGDVVRCRHSGCGALVPLPAPGDEGTEVPVCPLCSRR